MKNSNLLSIQRLSHLMVNDLRLQAKTVLIVAITIILLFALLPWHVTSDSAAYFLILYMGGFIMTSMAFNDLHDRGKAHLFLMLPCSNLERFLSKWLLTAIAYPLGLLVIYYLFSLLSMTVNLMVFNKLTYSLDLLQPTLWVGIGKYIILQAIVLLGAITFKKNVLIKTALVMICFCLMVSLLAVLLAWMFCPDCFRGAFSIFLSLSGWYFIFWIVVAPFCWYLTYLRLTEYELK